MLLPIGATFGTPGAAVAIPRVAVAIPMRAVEFRTILAGTIELRALTKRTIAFGAISARTRKTRALITIAVARLVVTWLVELRTIEIPSALASGARMALGAILSLLPRFGIATVAAKFPVAIWAIAKILARAARKFLVAVEFSLGATGERPIAAGTVTISRPRAEGAIAARTITVFAETLATRRVGPLLAALSRCVRFLVAEFSVAKFPVLETRGRPSVAVTIGPVAARRIGALVAAVFTWPERTLFALTASRRPIGKRAITARPRRIAVVTARWAIVTLSGIGTPLAFRLARKTALGEFLFRPPRNARAAFAA
jgi:hypothetical protein